MEYEAVIGVEVHAQIYTRSKMYCACPVLEDNGGLAPNSAVCPVCLALPGALPVVNRRAVEMGIRSALALNCEIATVNRFARKSYFYPDLPKGYQISQHALPLARDGYLDIETPQGPRRIHIRQVHLEEDAAKLLKTTGAPTRIDFNRAGVPLLEIVSAADMHTPAELQAYAKTLYRTLVNLRINGGNLESGALRFEANISVRPRGARNLNPRSEIKNLNSFRALVRSAEYEIQRQIALYRQGRSVEQQTLGWDEKQARTYPQRSKEQADDYRYFPEPDIPPLHITKTWIAEIRAQLPELPLAQKNRLVKDYAIRPYDAALLTESSANADYFERAAKLGQTHALSAQEIANWISGELFRLCNTTDIQLHECAVTPEKLVALLTHYQKGYLSSTAVKTVLAEIFTKGGSPDATIERLGLIQVSDDKALIDWIKQVIEQNPQQTQLYQNSKTGLLGWFVGQVMQISGGKANPAKTRTWLQKFLEQKVGGQKPPLNDNPTR